MIIFRLTVSSQKCLPPAVGDLKRHSVHAHCVYVRQEPPRPMVAARSRLVVFLLAATSHSASLCSRVPKPVTYREALYHRRPSPFRALAGRLSNVTRPHGSKPPTPPLVAKTVSLEQEHDNHRVHPRVSAGNVGVLVFPQLHHARRGACAERADRHLHDSIYGYH